MTVKKKNIKTLEIQEFVKKGGEIAVNDNPSIQKEKNFTLRLPVSLVEAIDTERSKSICKFSRNNWIIEAICEKLTSDYS